MYGEAECAVTVPVDSKSKSPLPLCCRAVQLDKEEREGSTLDRELRVDGHVSLCHVCCDASSGCSQLGWMAL